MFEEFSDFLPLSQAALHILMALAAGDQHGYAIMQDIAEQSARQYAIRAGTLYDNLQKMAKDGLVEEIPRPATDADARRRYYRITEHGRGVLTADIHRMERIIRAAKSRLRALDGQERPVHAEAAQTADSQIVD